MRRLGERIRCEGGFTLVETIVVTGLLLVVTVPLLAGVEAAQRAERTADGLSRAVATARVALDSIARQVRSADSLAAVGQNQAEAWFDDGDGVREPAEIVVYAIADPGDGLALLRAQNGATQRLAGDVTTASTLAVVVTPDGRKKLIVSLAVDADPARPPAATVMRTEVLARNAT